MDLTAMQYLPGGERHTDTIMGALLQEDRKGVLNNKGKYSRRITEKSPASDHYVDPGNTDAAIYMTAAIQGIIFEATWSTSRSFCLTYWQWGPGYWAYVNPEPEPDPEPAPE